MKMQFKMAAVMAYKEAYLKASPIILEPIAQVKIFAPSVYAGDISNDLKTRRARVLGMMPAEDGTSYIEADVPIAELEGIWQSFAPLRKAMVHLPTNLQDTDMRRRM